MLEKEFAVDECAENVFSVVKYAENNIRERLRENSVPEGLREKVFAEDDWTY